MIIIVFTIIVLVVFLIYTSYRAYMLAGVLADAQEAIEERDAYIIQLEETNRYMFSRINQTHDAMKQIDRLGAFEKDDEAGTTFQLLQQVIDELKTEFDENEEENK